MKKTSEYIYDFFFLTVGYPLGTIMSIIIYIASFIGIIRIVNYNNVFAAHAMREELDGGMYILSNHLGEAETVIAPSIVTFPEFLLHPFKTFPWCTPKKNLLYFPPINLIYFLRALPIDRDNNVQIIKHLKKKSCKLHVKKEIIMEFVEGTRTFSKRGKPARLINNKYLKPIKEGYWKVINSKNLCDNAEPEKVTVLPVWINYFKGFSWCRMELVFGEPAIGSEMPPDKIEEVLINL